MAKSFDDDNGGDADNENEAVKIPTREVLNKVLASLSKHGSTLQEVRGHISADMKEAEESGVHRQVIKLIDRLKRMDETKRADWFAHFDVYTETLDLRMQSQPGLFDDQDAA
jgi:uncharacterized protein (UPF0335 family)